MKIPKYVNIGKHRIEVNLSPPEIGDKQFIGRLDSRKLILRINPVYHRSLQEEALVHEIVHAVSIIYALGLNENQVAVLSEQIYSTILPLCGGNNVRNTTEKQ